MPDLPAAQKASTYSTRFSERMQTRSPGSERAKIGPYPRALQGPPIEFRISELPARGNVDQGDRVGAKTGALSKNVAGDHEFSPDCLETDCAVADARDESDARICSKTCVNSRGRSS